MPLKKPAPGDDLLRFAQKEGVSSEAIRARPENRELFAHRDPHVLHEEDELFVPEPEPAKFRVTPGNTYYFVYKPPTRILHLSLRDDDGSPRQVDYTLSDFVCDGPKPRYGRPFPDKLYGFAYQGLVREELPAAISQLTLTLEDALDDPLKIQLGRLDPVSTSRGLKARLASLGLFHDDVAGAQAGAELCEAIRLFQLSEKLPVSGHADPATRARLKAVCGG